MSAADDILYSPIFPEDEKKAEVEVLGYKGKMTVDGAVVNAPYIPMPMGRTDRDILMTEWPDPLLPPEPLTPTGIWIDPNILTAPTPPQQLWPYPVPCPQFPQPYPSYPGTLQTPVQPTVQTPGWYYQGTPYVTVNPYMTIAIAPTALNTGWMTSGTYTATCTVTAGSINSISIGSSTTCW
jgi:hypothetical protein